MIAYQDLPISGAIELSNSIIVDQGIAVGALILLFVIVVLFIAVLWRVLGNQRQENKDQSVLVVAVGNLAGIIEKFDKTAAMFASIVAQNDKRSSDDKQATNEAIESGAEKIAANTQELETTKAAVTIMSTDVDQIKKDLQSVQNTLNSIELKIGSGVCLDVVSQQLITQFLERARLLDEKLATITQETPAIDITAVITETEKDTKPILSPTPPGVPVTPKPKNETKE